MPKAPGKSPTLKTDEHIYLKNIYSVNEELKIDMETVKANTGL